MKVNSVNLISLVIILWSCIPKLCEGKCPSLIKLKEGPPLEKPYAQYIYPVALLDFCWTESDLADDGLQTIPKLIRTLISNEPRKGHTPPDPPERLPILRELRRRFDEDMAKGLITKANIQTNYCGNKTLDEDDLGRNVTLHPSLAIIANDSKKRMGPEILTASEVFELIPDPDTNTTFGDDSLCRPIGINASKCPDPLKKCGSLTNVTVAPTFFVNLTRQLCGILINDVELNDDERVATFFGFDDAKKNCADEGFFDGMSCIAYNTTLRTKLRNMWNEYLSHKEVYDVHFSRIGGSMLMQLSQFADELRRRRGGPKMLLEGGNCAQSFDYLDAIDKVLNYGNASVDGSYPFELLANWEKPEFNFTMESTVQQIINNSCNFTLGLFCNDMCTCECSRGKGNCTMVGLGKSSELLNNLVVTIGSVILGFTFWIAFPVSYLMN